MTKSSEARKQRKIANKDLKEQGSSESEFMMVVDVALRFHRKGCDTAQVTQQIGVKDVGTDVEILEKIHELVKIGLHESMSQTPTALKNLRKKKFLQ